MVPKYVVALELVNSSFFQSWYATNPRKPAGGQISQEAIEAVRETLAEFKAAEAVPLDAVPLPVLAAFAPFCDELSANNIAEAIKRLESLSPLDAVRLVFMAAQRLDTVAGDREVEWLGEALGVFNDDETNDRRLAQRRESIEE